MNADALKKTLRELKKMECCIRFGGAPAPRDAVLVWSRFFTAREGDTRNVKYPFSVLLKMEKQRIKDSIADFYLEVYILYYRENGIGGRFFDSELLSKLQLPPDSGIEDVKKRFRALAKKTHPDCGGDSAQFIELMETYRRLTE